MRRAFAVGSVVASHARSRATSRSCSARAAAFAVASHAAVVVVGFAIAVSSATCAACAARSRLSTSAMPLGAVTLTARVGFVTFAAVVLAVAAFVAVVVGVTPGAADTGALATEKHVAAATIRAVHRACARLPAMVVTSRVFEVRPSGPRSTPGRKGKTSATAPAPEILVFSATSSRTPPGDSISVRYGRYHRDIRSRSVR